MKGPQFTLVHTVDAETFERELRGRELRLPVLVKGACKQWPAFASWSFENLSKLRKPVRGLTLRICARAATPRAAENGCWLAHSSRWRADSWPHRAGRRGGRRSLSEWAHGAGIHCAADPYADFPLPEVSRPLGLSRRSAEVAHTSRMALSINQRLILVDLTTRPAEDSREAVTAQPRTSTPAGPSCAPHAHLTRRRAVPAGSSPTPPRLPSPLTAAWSQRGASPASSPPRSSASRGTT